MSVYSNLDQNEVHIVLSVTVVLNEYSIYNWNIIESINLAILGIDLFVYYVYI